MDDKRDAEIVSHLAQTIISIILLTTLIVTVIVTVNSYQAQNKSYQDIDLCMSDWELRHRHDTQKYTGECGE